MRQSRAAPLTLPTRAPRPLGTVPSAWDTVVRLERPCHSRACWTVQLFLTVTSVKQRSRRGEQVQARSLGKTDLGETGGTVFARDARDADFHLLCHTFAQNFQTRGARGSARLDARMYLKRVLVAPGLSVLGRRPPSLGRCPLLAQPRALRAALTPFDPSPTPRALRGAWPSPGHGRTRLQARTALPRPRQRLAACLAGLGQAASLLSPVGRARWDAGHGRFRTTPHLNTASASTSSLCL